MTYPDRIYGNCTPHINAAEMRDPERVKRLLSSPDVHVAYFLNAGEFWIDYALAQPNIDLVIVRVFNPFNEPDAHNRDADGNVQWNHKPQECLNYVMAHHRKYQGNKKVRFILWNEPTHNPDDPRRSLLALSQWMAEVGRLFATNGFGAALGAIAAAKTNSLTGKPENLEAWKPLLDVLALYPEWLHMDIHEYEYAFLPINYINNIATPFPFLFLDKRIADPANWGNIPYEGAAIYSNWKLGNIAPIMEYNENVLGHPPFAWGRGEWGTDTMTEPWWWNNQIGNNPPFEQTWRSKYGITAKGLHTLPRYYADLHDDNNWTMQKHNAFVIKQAAWFKRNSGKNCLYNTWYAWNTNEFWKTEDISHPDYIPFIEWMQTGQHLFVPIWVIPTPVPPPPVPAPRELRPIRLQGWDNAKGVPVNVYLRERPSTTSPDIGFLKAAPHVTEGWVSTAAPITGGIYTWQYYEFDAGKGYMATEFLRTDDDIPQPEPPPPPEPDYKALVLEAIDEQIEFYEHGIVQYTHQILFWRDVKDKLAS